MNEEAGWPPALRIMHWLTAALVLGALLLGVTMVQVVHDPGVRFELTQTHKSIGVAILLLAFVRLCLRIRATAPVPEPAAPLLMIAAKAVHIALYVLLLAMPLSGWLMGSTTPVRVPTSIFGLFDLPYPLAPEFAAYRFARGIHVACAISLALLIAFHVAATLVHSLFWHDHTVRRMWPERRRAGYKRSGKEAALGRNRAGAP
jgi:cytochrome b561